MLLTRVAVVPYEMEIDPRELMYVSAALQTQVIRDLSPIWGVSAVVCPFQKLKNVPPGYVPLALIDDELPLHRAGFHLPAGGQAAALVQYCGDWTGAASHELIEMLCDPSGTATRTAPSLSSEQGLVEYLMEVCDPVERSGYIIDGVIVSDFVTPHYYDAPGTTGGPYSFTGRVGGPLQLLEGGYITWTAPDDAVYQVFGPGGDPTKLADVPPNFSRQAIDADDKAKESMRGRECGKGPQFCERAVAKRYGTMLHDEIERIVRSVQPLPAEVGGFRELIWRLGSDDDFRRDFMANPSKAVQKAGLTIPVGKFPPSLSALPDKEHYQDLLHALDQGHRFGVDFADPMTVAALGKMARHWP
jgi:hypothetical protein